MIDFNPCRKCGSDKVSTYVCEDNLWMCYCECDDCGCFSAGGTMIDAIENWKRMYEQTTKNEEYRP